MPKGPCKFFAYGACLKGEHCKFSHSQKDAPNNICRSYQKGVCAYGSRCRYEHVKASEAQSSSSSFSANGRQYRVSGSVPSRAAGGAVSWVAKDKQPLSTPIRESGIVPPDEHSICSFADTGNCSHGEKCPHIHGDLCPTCGKYCLHPSQPVEREEHMKTCEKKQKHLEALKRSQEIECSVCMEHVLSKSTAAERRFGVLSECDHPFCISCIRNWRNSSPSPGMDVNSTLRACPVCRKLSYFFVPSTIWFYSKEEKQEIIDCYKAKLKSIDCKHFEFGNGHCPFGTSCFYKHTVKPGSYAWIHHGPPPRRPRLRRSRPGGSNYFDMDDVLDMYSELDLEPEEFYMMMKDSEFFDGCSPLEILELAEMLGSGPNAFNTEDSDDELFAHLEERTLLDMLSSAALHGSSDEEF
ncbi:Zinc finger CCCH domain-containing protein 69 [Quillaja saponaria]|uniref:Zinc finger CCCH domain-containing protein 69 n=1 Tax=Quillaja saponaria TaxID=32244 RepID=A0AAD7QK96_QUISA|nr:Zinc finger CCCH domain-containing protein 69 [Quillaja saponaria]